MTSTNTPADIISFIKAIHNDNIDKVKKNVSLNGPYICVFYNYNDKNANSNQTIGRVVVSIGVVDKNHYDSQPDLIEKLSRIRNNRVNIDPKDFFSLYRDVNPDLNSQSNLSIDTILNNMDKIDNIFCFEKAFYDKGNNIIFKEEFRYRDKDSPEEGERRISTLFDSSGQVIGFGYYEDYNVFGNCLITIKDGQEINMISHGITIELDSPTFISDDINRKLYANKLGILIGGKVGLSYDYSAILNEICEEKQDNKCCISPIVLLNKDDEANNILKDITNYNEPITKLNLTDKINDKKIVLLPVGTEKHASTIIIDLEHMDTFYSFDSSLAHYIRYSSFIQLNKNTFGDYLTAWTKPLINNSNLQFNGTCTYWSDAFCEVVVTSPEYNGSNGEDGLENIKRDCANGTMFLKCAKSIGRIFDKDLNLPTVKIYEDQNVDNNNYYNFTINGKNYGISKTSGLNKFVDLETLIETLGVEQEEKNRIKNSLKNQIEGQRKIEEKEREIFNFKQLEKIEKVYENKIKEIKPSNSNTANQPPNDELIMMTAEKNKFCGQFSKYKQLYNSIEDREIKCEALKCFVELDQDLNTTKISDYVNSSDLNNQLETFIEEIKNYDFIKKNQNLLDFRSKVENTEIILNTEEAIPNIHNQETTNPLSSISVVVPTNVENSANPRPPTDLKNHDKKTTEKTMV